MNTEAVNDWASYIVLNRINFTPREFGKTDPRVVVCLDELAAALKAPPAEVEVPAERLSILDT